jgi:hypothetical protein
MRRTLVSCQCMGLAVAALALGAGPASAKTVLTLKTAAGPLAAGQEVVAESADLKFVTEAGTLECASNILTGVLENNGATKDKGKVSTESSTGAEPGGACKTTTPLGYAKITSSELPWPTEYTTKGTSTLKGSKKVVFTAVFPEAGGATCVYEAAKVVSSINTSGVITQAVSNQVFKANKKTSNPACPKEGKLNGTFKGFSKGEAIEAEL